MTITQRSDQTGAVACIVWAEYTPESVKHRPYLMNVGGRPAAARTLARLESYFGNALKYFVVCWRDQSFAEFSSAIQGANVEPIATEAPNADEALRRFCAAQTGVQTAMFFAPNAVLTDCALARRMLDKHLEARADVTFMSVFSDGIAPVAIINVAALRAGWPPGNQRSTLSDIIRSIVSGGDGRFRILDYSNGGAVESGLDGLPESALVVDERSRLAAGRALEFERDSADSRAAVAFKRMLIDLDERPRPFRQAQPRRTSAQTVLFSSLQPAFSGGEQSLFTSITNLDRNEFEPVVVLPFETILADMLSRAGVPVEIAGWDYIQLCPGNLRYSNDLLDRLRPSIVHVDGFVNPALMTAAKVRGIPVIGHLRVFTGGKAPVSMRMADRIVTVSDAIAYDVRRNDIRPDRVLRIYNGVSADRLTAGDVDRAALRRQHKIGDQARVLSLIARITPFKRVDLLIDALPRILAAEPRAHAVIAGEAYGQDLDYYEELRARVRRNGLEQHVTWWGFEREIGRIYAISELLVHANRREPLARSMLEALACGLPLIGPRDGGTCEVIEHGRNGLLYEPDSSEDLAAAVTLALSDEAARLRMAEYSHAKSREFSVERHIQQLQSLYRELLAAKAQEAHLESAAVGSN